MPIPFLSPDFAATLAELRRTAEEAGRDPATVRITACGGLPDPALLDGWRELGVERTILGLPSAGLDDVRRVLDSHAPLLAR
jgi:nucleotide-binding universal stress UspA family protein